VIIGRSGLLSRAISVLILFIHSRARDNHVGKYSFQAGPGHGRESVTERFLKTPGFPEECCQKRQSGPAADFGKDKISKFSLRSNGDRYGLLPGESTTKKTQTSPFKRDLVVRWEFLPGISPSAAKHVACLAGSQNLRGTVISNVARLRLRSTFTRLRTQCALSSSTAGRNHRPCAVRRGQ